jgi:hypothetical protein
MRAFRLPVAGALAAATFIALAGMSPAGASGDDSELIRVQDDCDPETFNAVLGEGACAGDGDTTFDEFIEEMEDEQEAGKWRNNPDDTHIDHGESLHVVNEGGEFHSFTMVPEFGPGCVPELNALSGFGFDAVPVVDCSLLGTTGLPVGGELTIDNLSPGEYLFECLIHPWMLTSVEVRED